MIAELTPTQAKAQEIEATTRVLDIENECSHGHLPFDTNRTCECWTLQRTHALIHQEPLVLHDYEIDPDRIGAVFTVTTTAEENAEARTAERRERAQEMHRIYIEQELSCEEVGRKYKVSGSRARQLFHEFDLEVKPRGWRATRDRQTAAAKRRGELATASLAHSTPVAPAPEPAPVVKPEPPMPPPIEPEILDRLGETPVQSKARELTELLVAELATVEARALELRDQIATVEGLR